MKKSRRTLTFRTPSGIESPESQPPSPCSTTDRSHHPAPQDPETDYNEVSIITIVLCWTAFASPLGAMNVMREGKQVKPAIAEEVAMYRSL
ncbi:hypothetical protein PSHT_14579 [Puccinia striiformis]|uniref:Uncharacterized protein n=1 Tax=Puccinia striiformis TaxID=27350 RepID=A0A2S4UJJ1_9BASI|nr:hypothetical protein PSHT_14579 [Puccinia striiformis]